MAGEKEMTYKAEFLLALTIILSSALYAKSADKNQEGRKNTSAQANVQPDETERIFETHCARCHMPPMTLSQRTTGTVVMHMRMRARLSRRDEQLLLKYLAP
jgi:mono/diheme cytochrome c family protein